MTLPLVDATNDTDHQISATAYNALIAAVNALGEVVESSGTYTPTFSGLSNVDSVAPEGVWYWSRRGQDVNVWGVMTLDATAAAYTETQISLPVASMFTALGQASGSVVINNTAHQAFSIFARTGTALVYLTGLAATTLAGRTHSVRLIYRIV